MLRTDDLDYDLPQSAIATHPAEPRDAARLLVVRRDDPGRFEHATVRDLPEFLRPSDRVVFNTTRVMPARFRGVREDTGGRVEGLFLQDESEQHAAPVWAAMLKSRRHKPGAIVRLLAGSNASPYMLEMLEPVGDAPGAWRVRLRADDPALPTDPPSVLDTVGLTPLPPYILAARRAAEDPGDDADDRAQYQTTYADRAQPGSVAAPTAGLHFTPDLLERLRARGVDRTDVVLHVGAGTFKPVETEHVEDHRMHAEWCSMSRDAIDEVRATKAAGGRVVAVGTTSVRTLEAYAPLAADPPERLSTRLLLTPGSRLAWTDAMLTNFHLPRSTLMALVAAALQDSGEPPGRDGVPPGVLRLKAAYREAIEHGYRFYSFGDAMLVL